mmetsp:Transcript_14871/g.33192  ORF Transcript_14871/g.33192 Transcript_14871/m.33192 type:complete len:258 (+) Transcript_14871:622-1395(+)
MDAGDVAGGGDGRTAARAAVFASPTLDRADLAVGVDTDVRAEDDEAGSTVGDVTCHGPEGGDSAEGEAGQTSHAEVVIEGLAQIVLEDAVDLIGAEGGGDETVLAVAVHFEGRLDVAHKLLVLLGAGEALFDGILHLLGGDALDAAQEGVGCDGGRDGAGSDGGDVLGVVGCFDDLDGLLGGHGGGGDAGSGESDRGGGTGDLANLLHNALALRHSRLLIGRRRSGHGESAGATSSSRGDGDMLGDGGKGNGRRGGG